MMDETRDKGLIDIERIDGTIDELRQRLITGPKIIYRNRQPQISKLCDGVVAETAIVGKRMFGQFDIDPLCRQFAAGQSIHHLLNNNVLAELHSLKVDTKSRCTSAL